MRNFYGKCGGGQSMLNLTCAPGRPVNRLPIDSIPESQVSNIVIEKGFAYGDFTIENEAVFHGLIKEFGIQLLSTDVGSFKNIKIRDVSVEEMTTFGLAIIKATDGAIANQNIDIRDCEFNLINGGLPQLPHQSFLIHRKNSNEVNLDLESANEFIGDPGNYIFR